MFSNDSEDSDSTKDPLPYQPTESFNKELDIVKKKEDNELEDSVSSKQSLAQVKAIVSTPPPTEELGIEQPSLAQSSHPVPLLDSTPVLDAFSALQDEDRSDHLNYEEDSDDMQDTNQLDEENRAYAGINLTPSGEVINLENSDTDADANRNVLFNNCLDAAKNKCSDTNYKAVERAISILKSNQIPRNILIIGLGYNRKLSYEINHGGVLNEIEQCLDKNGKQVSASVARDTIRAYFVEQLNDRALVHSVNNCTDSYTSTLEGSDTELNISINTSKFLQTMVDKDWTFNHVYIDHYKMSHPYLVDMLPKTFFKEIIKMAKSSILHKIGNKMPQIFLPLAPHTFYMIHSMEEINMVYEISYMNEIEANTEHLLYSATNSIL